MNNVLLTPIESLYSKIDMHLTKSDFTIARTCPTKLYYKKLRFPSLNDENQYLEFLADGGYMVEKMAKLLYSEGKDLGNWDNPSAAFDETRDAIESGDGTYFEATVIHDVLMARIDILARQGDVLRLIEVKSSSINSTNDGRNPFRGKRGGIESEWMPYLEDVAFQSLVLSRAFPQLTVVPYLCVVDKSKSATENATFDKFQLSSNDATNCMRRYEVEYTGNVERLRKEHILTVINVSREVDELQSEVHRAVVRFADTLRSDPIQRITPEIGQHCKSCEYRLPRDRDERNGFRDCWGNLADPDPHMLDLYRIDLVGGKKRDVVAEFAADGHSGLLDIPAEALSGSCASRQELQIHCTATNKEYIDPKLTQVLSAHPYPLYFIDFEGSRLAIPYYDGMRPYEQASFQWSCHTIRTVNTDPEHHEWLNDEDAFPNFDFARSLRNAIGNRGTVYIWSKYEITVLREIREQMLKYHEDDTALGEWIDTLLLEEDSRVVDLCDLAKKHYFHPAMKGSLSIKYVLPAVWKASAVLRDVPLLREYAKFDQQGSLLNPYATLPPLPIGSKEEVVTEGTGAMRVYQEMMFGRSRNEPHIRENYRRLLLQYCKLDTAAMVAIWMHWSNPTSLTTGGTK